MAPSALSSSMTLSNESKTKIPKLVYGTAWKKDRSADLVYNAIKAGFRGIDTAAQPRHYQENLVGDGIRRAINEGMVEREDLYVRPFPPSQPKILLRNLQIQTKFTGLSGQDPKNMPYSASSPLEERIHTSLASSFNNLRTTTNAEETYLDALVLHSPLPTIAETHLAWSVFSTYVPHRIRSLGISNTTLSVLQSLFTSTTLTIKPSVVQNRFYPDTDWEVHLRKFCREKGVVFQSFWTFTGNPGLMESEVVGGLAREIEKVGIRVEEADVVALYSLVVGLDGVTVLDGTTNSGRMKADLEGLEVVGRWAEGDGREGWDDYSERFRKLIGEI
jgi:diketogulonate reductase-like aldo/keto reductase